MSGNEVDVLPDRPLRQKDIVSIKNESELEDLSAVYRLVEDERTIICVFGLTSDMSAFYIYNPKESQWEVLFEQELLENAYGKDGRKAQDELREESEKIQEYYDIDKIDFVEPNRDELTDEDVIEDLLPLLPDEPLSQSQLKEFRSEPEISELVPHTYLTETDEVILFSISYKKEGDGGKVALLRYTNEMDTWISDGEIDNTEKGFNEDMESLIDESYNDMEDEYEREKLTGFNSIENVRNWWNK